MWVNTFFLNAMGAIAPTALHFNYAPVNKWSAMTADQIICKYIPSRVAGE